MRVLSGKPIVAITLTLLILLAVTPALAADWLNWRGPKRDGRSPETGLVDSWSPDGENLLWKKPIAGRSTPVVHGDRLYMLNAAGEGASLQERILCLDANTGEQVWEYRYNVFHSDAPPRRIAWSSPVVDEETGNIYAYGVAGMMTALTPDGKLLWQRSMAEEINTLSTHGGRTVSPVIEGDLVIASAVTLVWGQHAPPRHRFFAFDKMTGDIMWLSAPGAQPYDTTYSTPIGADLEGMRLIIAGSGDGSVVALKPQTGEKVWRYAMSKRGVNTEPVVDGTLVLASHGEENLNTSEMGLLVGLDGTAEGDIPADGAKWRKVGFLGGYSSPVLNEGVLYQVDNGSNLYAFDVATGERLWMENLGTIQKASPVYADGKLYVGNENGDFFIIKVSREGCEILDRDRLGGQDTPERITASPAISNGRIFVVTDAATYAFGTRKRVVSRTRRVERTMEIGPPSYLRVSPTELILSPGDTVQLEAQLFDEHGIALEGGDAAWSLDGITGEIGPDGKLTVGRSENGEAGLIKAVVEQNGHTVTGMARARVIPPLPWDEDFDDRQPGPPPKFWVNATGKFEIREMDGTKVLTKLADNPATQRARVMMGPTDWHDYTVQVDVRATERRRRMGDAGVVAQRYALVLFGNHQRLEIHPWQADPRRTVQTDFAWEKDTWYRLKLRVENLNNGDVKLQGKVWPVGEEEPSAWTLEHVDPVPNREGSPGLYADAPFEIFFDNFQVTSND